ncbi:MAG: hypothetical protein R3A52_21485 [Polyangiales bacterium]
MRLQLRGDVLDGALCGDAQVRWSGDRAPTRDGACWRWTRDLSAHRAEGGWRVPLSVAIPRSRWVDPDARVTVTADAERPLRVSGPWGADGESDPSLFVWEGYVVVAPFSPRALRAAGCALNVAPVGATAGVDDGALDRWLGGAARAVASLYGRFPGTRLQAVLLPGPPERGVAFGLSSRGGGGSVLFVVDPGARDLSGDWVATHEFVHLGQPVLDGEDAWFREGLATYYQEVLRARVGLQSPEAAWRNLAAGMRNVDGDGTGRDLAGEAEAMPRTGAWRRVYWTGAALALGLDLALRRDPTAPTDLDEVSRAMHALSTRSPLRAWTLDALRERLASSAFDRAWAAVVVPALRGGSPPPWRASLRGLGVDPESGAIDDRAPGAAIRRAITSRR